MVLASRDEENRTRLDEYISYRLCRRWVEARSCLANRNFKYARVAERLIAL